MIDQSSCNKDYSCIEGFCPSFVSVIGGQQRCPERIENTPTAHLPEPPLAAIDGCYNNLINGVGGTGVVTIGAVLGMAAHLEGKGSSVYDMTGLAQKGGSVFSHLKIAQQPDDIGATRIGATDADLLLGCDLVVSAGKDCLSTLRSDRSHAVIDRHLVPTMTFQVNPDVALDAGAHADAIRNVIGPQRTHLIDTTGIARLLLGDTIGANLFTVGYAAQLGFLPLGMQAIELNGIAVAFNLQAFDLGRVAAHDASAIETLLDTDASKTTAEKEAGVGDEIDALVQRRAAFLSDYQDATYAERYRAMVERARQRAMKRNFGPWMLGALRVLARFKHLRGSVLDSFGYTAERRRKRKIRDDYLALVETLLEQLSADNHETAVRLAEVPELIRGYGYVKTQNLAQARKREQELLAQFRAPKEEIVREKVTLES